MGKQSQRRVSAYHLGASDYADGLRIGLVCSKWQFAREYKKGWLDARGKDRRSKRETIKQKIMGIFK